MQRKRKTKLELLTPALRFQQQGRGLIAVDHMTQTITVTEETAKNMGEPLATTLTEDLRGDPLEKDEANTYLLKGRCNLIIKLKTATLVNQDTEPTVETLIGSNLTPLII